MKQFKLIIGIAVLMIAFAVLVGCVPPNLTAYSITYDGNGSTDGNVEDTAVYLEGNAVPVLGQGNLVKPDYVFAGWRTQDSQDRLIVDRSITVIEDDGTMTFFEGSTFNMPAHNVVLYAQWQLQSFSITYGNMAGATNHVDNPASYTSETPQITLGAPSKAGHDFLGWYTAADFSGTAVTTIPTGSTQNTTLFAKWTPSQYTVTFDAQNGSAPNPATIDVTYGSTYGALASTSRTGYDFIGWFTGTNGSGIKVTSSIGITSASNHTLYAQWQLQSFSITYGNMAGATNHVDNPASYTSETPQITLGAPSKAGHDFLGWYTTADFSGTAVTTIPTGSTQNTTLFAKWTPSQYTVTFDAQNGSAPNPATIDVTYGSTYGALASTSRTGYDFLGWFTGTNGSGLEVTETSSVIATMHHTLYAYWKTALIPVESVSIIGDTIIGTELLATPYPLNTSANYRWQIADTSDGTYTNIPGASSWTYVIKPADEGKYLRVVANGTGLYTGTAISNITNKVLYEYTITYNNLEDGANHPDNTATYTTETPEITLGSPSKPEHFFLGWYDTDDFSGEIVTAITSGSTGNKILYAKWIPPITVTFNEEGGTDLNPTSKTVTYSETYGTLATVEKTGHTFDGWWTGEDGAGNLINSDSVVSVSVDHTLYANWEPNTYTITYDAQNGAIADPTTTTVTYGQTYGELASTTKESYSFAGWWTGIGGTGNLVTEATIFTETADRILYAKWTFDVFIGPTGGLVFYENPNHATENWRYLEAAPYGWYAGGDDPSMQWGAYGYSVEPSSTATTVGIGKTNSDNIVEYHTDLWNLFPAKGDYYTNPTEYFALNDGTVAAKVCAEYSMVNGEKTYDDWFLPSKDELNLMYLNLKVQGLGNVSSNNYWSSSEKDSNGAWRQLFNNGNSENTYRYAESSVRPIRAY